MTALQNRGLTSKLGGAGFLIRYPDIPSYWSWYSYLNFLSYAWCGQMINQWENHPDVLINGEPVRPTMTNFPNFNLYLILQNLIM